MLFNHQNSRGTALFFFNFQKLETIRHILYYCPGEWMDEWMDGQVEVERSKDYCSPLKYGQLKENISLTFRLKVDLTTKKNKTTGKEGNHKGSFTPQNEPCKFASVSLGDGFQDTLKTPKPSDSDAQISFIIWDNICK